MSSQAIVNDLSAIIYDAKKKSPELRSAADKSLQELKGIHITSETQLGADLSRRPYFINPFLIACKTHNAKFTLPAVSSLHRLAVLKGLSKDRLLEVLDALQETTSSGLDIQLKILQCLTSLLQNYSDDLEGDLQFKTLKVCTTLQQVKATAVSRTAAATLQQIVTSLFEKVEHEDENAESISPIAKVSVNDKDVPVRPAAYDAHRVFDDLCLLTEGERPRYLLDARISQNFGMELIESVLTNHKDIFDTHQEQAQILKDRVMPLLTRLISERLAFPATVRSIRLLCILLREYLNIVKSECEIPLSLLNHTLESETSNTWRRALCMETFRVIYSSADLPLILFSLFDADPNSKNVVQENLASFVRLSAEKPSLIGLGQQSSVPSGPETNKTQDPAVLEAGGVAGVISGGDVGVSEVNAAGISSQWSSMKTPCLDQLDKTEPTQIPDTYAYSLVLTCINNLSEALAKVVLPMAAQQHHKSEGMSKDTSNPDVAQDEDEAPTSNGNPQRPQSIPRRSRARSMLANPLTMVDHPSHDAVTTASKLISDCWPAIMATCSTFMYAALDADYYRNLVRSFQKLTQVAGILRLNTPRDAFLTALAKSAIPPNIVRGEAATLSPQTPGLLSPGAVLRSPSLSSESMWSQVGDSGGSSHRSTDHALTQRNLMCLRALVNLAIALGPILEAGWPIILHNLESADLVLKSSTSMSSSRDFRPSSQHSQSAETPSQQGNFGNEVAAVEAAITRLMKSTSDWPNASFIALLQAFCTLIGKNDVSKATSPLRARFQHQRRISSMSGSLKLPATDSMHSVFAITKVGELAQVNLRRLALEEEDAGWALIQETMLFLTSSSKDDNAVRLMAADIIGSIAVEAAVSTLDEPEDVRRVIQQRSVLSLKKEIDALYEREVSFSEPVTSADAEIHRSALEALQTILEQCGDALMPGWETILDVTNSVFRRRGGSPRDGPSLVPAEEQEIQLSATGHVPAKLIRSAFGSIQLICSDFLAARSSLTMVMVIDILSRFAFQTVDLNISLTAITLFWRVSDFLQDKTKELSFDGHSANLGKIDDFVKGLTALASNGSFAAPWFLLQHRLVSMTTDSRADVRNGATHTIFRILDITRDQLSPSVWDLYLRKVILRLARLNYDMQKQARSEAQEADAETMQALNGSTKLIIESSSQAICDNFDSIIELYLSSKIWDDTLDTYSHLLDFGSNELGTAVFHALSQILGQLDKEHRTHHRIALGVFSMWQSKIPTTNKSPSSNIGEKASSETSLVAYTELLSQLHRLLGDEIDEQQVNVICDNLRQCLLVGKVDSYTSDVDRMTALQTQVLERFEMMRRHVDIAGSAIVSHIANFVTLPYNDDTGRTQNLTYVAFAKRTCSLLLDMIKGMPSLKDVLQSGTLLLVFRSLANAIKLRYDFAKQGSAPSLWQKSASAALGIFDRYIAATAEASNEMKSEIWTEITRLIEGLLEVHAAAVPSNETLVDDETFDITAARQVMESVKANTGALLTPQSSLSNYTATIFRASVIHTLSPDEVPKEVLHGDGSTFGAIRFGRTYDPTFSPRLRMCYFCVDELFSLIADGGESAGHTDLAQEAFRYLMQRCALPLKTYIADQPLRGRMPTPMSQRLELFHILKRLQSLDCNPDLFLAADEHVGVSKPRNPAKRHLEVLAPLLYKALGQALADKELAEEMRSTLNLAFS